MSRAIRKGTLSGLNTEANNNKVRWQNLLRSNFKTLPPNLTKEQSVIIGEEFLQLRSSTFNHIVCIFSICFFFLKFTIKH